MVRRRGPRRRSRDGRFYRAPPSGRPRPLNDAQRRDRIGLVQRIAETVSRLNSTGTVRHRDGRAKEPTISANGDEDHLSILTEEWSLPDAAPKDLPAVGRSSSRGNGGASAAVAVIRVLHASNLLRAMAALSGFRRAPNLSASHSTCQETFSHEEK
jgi:hypothetical protein